MRVGKIVGIVVGTIELIMELICDDRELSSDDTDDTTVEIVVNVGSVTPELLDELS